MNTLPREIVAHILDLCAPEAYLTLIESGLNTAYPVDKTQYDQKKEAYKIAQRNAKKQMIKDGIMSGMSNLERIEGQRLQGISAQIVNASQNNKVWLDHLSEIVLNHSDVLEEIADTSFQAGDVITEEMIVKAGRKLMASLTPTEMANLMTPEILQIAINMVNLPEIDDETREVTRQIQENVEMQPVFEGWYDQMNQLNQLPEGPQPIVNPLVYPWVDAEFHQNDDE